MTDTAHTGRHRKTSAYARPIHRIVTETASAGIIGKDLLYVSLTDADTGIRLGIDFEARAIDELRRVLLVSL